MAELKSVLTLENANKNQTKWNAKTKTEFHQAVIQSKLNTKCFRVVCSIMKTRSFFFFFENKKSLLEQNRTLKPFNLKAIILLPARKMCMLQNHRLDV